MVSGPKSLHPEAPAWISRAASSLGLASSGHCVTGIASSVIHDRRRALIGFDRFSSYAGSESAKTQISPSPIPMRSPRRGGWKGRVRVVLSDPCATPGSRRTLTPTLSRRTGRGGRRRLARRCPATLHGRAARPCARTEARRTQPLDLLWKSVQKFLKSGDFPAGTAARPCARARSTPLTPRGETFAKQTVLRIHSGWPDVV